MEPSQKWNREGSPVITGQRTKTVFPEILSTHHCPETYLTEGFWGGVAPQVYRVQAEVDLQRGSDSRARLELLSSPAGSYTLLIFVHQKNPRLTFNLQQMHAGTSTLWLAPAPNANRLVNVSIFRSSPVWTEQEA